MPTKLDETESTVRSNNRWAPSLVFFRNCLIGLILISPLLLRAWFLSKIPDIPEPFNVDEFCKVDITPGQNAFDHYREAYRLKEAIDVVRKTDNNEALWANYDEVTAKGWSSASDSLKKWLEDYREVLAEWKRGTECSDALYLSRREMDFASQIPVSHSLREIAKVAQCNAARLEAEGNLKEAGETWIAILRSSRHAGRSGVAVEQLTGRAMHHWATEGLNRWAAHPDVTRDHLISVQRQVREADELSLPLSSLFKAEYLAASNTLKRHDWIQLQMDQFCGNRSEYEDFAKRVLYWTVGEPVATQRLMKHILANQLNEIDEPLPERRPYVGVGVVMLFDPDPTVPRKPRHLNPAEIERALQRSMVSKTWIENLKFVVDMIDRERAQQVTIELALMLQAYRRDHGEFPDDPSAIVPTYAEAWPVDPCDKRGKSIRYRRDISQSAVVWSVGPDGNDDGGEVADTKSGKSVDVGFFLKAP
jgi:hypothetical protein